MSPDIDNKLKFHLLMIMVISVVVAVLSFVDQNKFAFASSALALLAMMAMIGNSYNAVFRSDPAARDHSKQSSSRYWTGLWGNVCMVFTYNAIAFIVVEMFNRS